MERNNGYLKNKEYESSETLKKYDPNEKKLPITYSAGCTRRIVKSAGRRLEHMEPQFGVLLLSPAYQSGALEACRYYQRLLALTVLSLYGEPISTQNMDEITPEMAADIIRRFYPSNYNWLISRDSRGSVHGKVENPRELPEEINDILGSVPELRRKYFQVNYRTGKFEAPGQP